MAPRPSCQPKTRSSFLFLFYFYFVFVFCDDKRKEKRGVKKYSTKQQKNTSKKKQNKNLSTAS
jgi:hypothetical protein